jgi:hypothetical protein
MNINQLQGSKIFNLSGHPVEAKDVKSNGFYLWQKEGIANPIKIIVVNN